MPKLIFYSQNRSIALKEGTELRQAFQLDPTLPLKFECCKGQCGTCAIKIISGKENLSPQTKEEKETLNRLNLDFHRLACQCAILGNVVIE